jgi:pimeloyl-ACP methyl ester carboxylesterase
MTCPYLTRMAAYLPTARTTGPSCSDASSPMWIAEPGFSHAEMQGIEAPTLIIIGDRDIVTPEHAVEMFRSIPGAQLCVVPHAGHGVMPKETVLAFLEAAGAADQ